MEDLCDDTQEAAGIATSSAQHVLDQHGQVWPGDGSTRELQLPPYVIQYEAGLHVVEKGKLTAEIIVGSEVGYLVKLPETLSDYAYYITCVVEAFEVFSLSRTAADGRRDRRVGIDSERLDVE